MPIGLPRRGPQGLVPSSLLRRAVRPVSALVALIICAAFVCVGTPALAASPQPAARNTPAVGVQDSSVNDCYQYQATVKDKNGKSHKVTRNRTSPDFTALKNRITVLNKYWAKLNVHTLRYSPEWDLADSQSTVADGTAMLKVKQACFDYWLALVAQAPGHVDVEIAFKPDYNDVRNGEILVPDLRHYTAAIHAFLADYTDCTPAPKNTCAPPATQWPYPVSGGMAPVRIIAPWGEPDFAGKTKAGLANLAQIFHLQSDTKATFDDAKCTSETAATCGPVLAAAMWSTVAAACQSCSTVIAGDFSSAAGLEAGNAKSTYLSIYARHLPKPGHGAPAVWAVHPYSDTSDFEWCHIQKKRPAACPAAPTSAKALAATKVGHFASALHNLKYGSHSQIWLDEVSTYTVDMFKHGKPKPPTYSQKLQAQATGYLINDLSRAGGATAPGEPVVTRIYYFRYDEDQPVALIVKGKPALLFHVIANRHNSH